MSINLLFIILHVLILGCCWPCTVFTPRVVSTAVARYNFAARDMRELSLREGDIVKIYSKIGGDQGWWKGEANGRVIKQVIDLKLSFKYHNISNINCHYFPVFHSDWMVPLYVCRWGGGAVKLWGQRSSNKIHSPLRGLWFPWQHLMEVFFAGNIFYNEYLYFCRLSSCTNMFFPPPFSECLCDVCEENCSESVRSQRWEEETEQSRTLPWSGQRTSMALSLYRNTCKVRWGIMGGGDI